MNKIFYLKEAWYKVDLMFTDTEIKFKAFKIEALDEENIENSDINNYPDVYGNINWDFSFTIHSEMNWINRDFKNQFDILIEFLINKAEKKFNDKF